MMQTGLGPPSATRADGDCAWLLAGLAAAQERPHLVGRVPAMTSGGAHRRDAAAAGPVGHRSLGDLEEERDLARSQQAAAHAAREQAAIGPLLAQCLTVPTPLPLAPRRGSSRLTALDTL